MTKSMKRRKERSRYLTILFIFILCLFENLAFAGEPLSFYVLNQRSVTLTAEYWNPILRYVSTRSNVPLRLKIGRTAPETTRMTVEEGNAAFAYTNQLFTPARDRLEWRAIARPVGKHIHGAIVVREDSRLTILAQLSNKEVGFPSPEAFVGYWLPMDALLKAGIRVTPLFGGNQEGVMGQLKTGRIAAAGVNAEIMADYATREKLRYHTIWKSEAYLNLPIMAHPRVSRNTVKAVREAFIQMARDEEGKKILQAAANLIGANGETGFVAADDQKYDNYRRFYRGTVLPIGTE